MKEQFVTYDIAKKLKKLGFDEECFTYFYDDGELSSFTIRPTKNSLCAEAHCAAALWQQAIDWFREKHFIVVEVPSCKYFDTFANAYPYTAICKMYKDGELNSTITVRSKTNSHIFYSYHEAREQAILKAIELCQK